MQTSYTKVETFEWGKLENYKSIGRTTKSGETNVKISVGDGGGLGARNVSFSINFAYVLSKLSLIRHLIMNITSIR